MAYLLGRVPDWFTVRRPGGPEMAGVRDRKASSMRRRMGSARPCTQRAGFGRPLRTALLGTSASLLLLVGQAGPVSASVQPATSPVSLVTEASGGPYSSGQIIEIRVAPNPILKPRASLTIEVCSLPSRRTWPHSWRCDSKTKQHDRVVAGLGGTMDYQDYEMFALPDRTTLDEQPGHRPVCNLTHQCVLMVGWDLDDRGHRVWSLPFFVNPTPGDTGLDPGVGTPEVPYVIALPLLAGGILGGTVLVRRRRRTHANTD
jgi:hypothetical protein